MTDLDLWDCLGRTKLGLCQNYIRLIKLFVVILEKGKPCLINKIIIVIFISLDKKSRSKIPTISNMKYAELPPFALCNMYFPYTQRDGTCEIRRTHQELSQL